VVLAVCRRTLRDNTDAEDAFQATFLVLARKAGSIRKQETLAAWLHRVGLNISRTIKLAAARAGRSATRV
jgi:DNA-directed RNA polymerase specialized sigma24 family protein